MPIFVRDELALLFIHIPKTGGTALGNALLKSGWSRSFHAWPGSEPDRYHLRRVSPQHFHARLLRETLRVRRFDLSFCMVREPLARFRSEYAMRCQDPAAGAAETVEAWAEAKLDKYRKEPTLLDNHLRPQHEFTLRDTVVYRYEDGLEAAVDDLVGRGIHIEGPLAMLKSSQVHADRLRSQDVRLSPRLVDRLTDFYREDFRRFGYDA